MQSAAERIVFSVGCDDFKAQSVLCVFFFFNYVVKSFMTAGQKRHETTAKHMNLTWQGLHWYRKKRFNIFLS